MLYALPNPSRKDSVSLRRRQRRRALRLTGQQLSCVTRTKENTWRGPGSAEFGADHGPQWDRGQGGKREPKGSRDLLPLSTISQGCYLLVRYVCTCVCVHAGAVVGGVREGGGAQREEQGGSFPLLPSLILSSQQLSGARSGCDLSYVEEGMGSCADNKTNRAKRPLPTMSDQGHTRRHSLRYHTSLRPTPPVPYAHKYLSVAPLAMA